MAGIITDTNKLGGVPQTASRRVAMSTCFDVFHSGGEGAIHLGFITQITPGHTRTVTQVRHLNSVDAGIAIDTVVTPDAVTLNFNGFYVYTQVVGNTGLGAANIGKAMVAGDIGVGPSAGRMAGLHLLMTLDQQKIPFDIVVRHSMPGTTGFVTTPDAGQIIGVYKNCTISNMSIPINIGTAGIADSGTISVGYVAKNT